MTEKELKKHAVRALELWYGMTPCKKDMVIKECKLNENGVGYYHVKVRHIDYKIDIMEGATPYNLYYVTIID